MPLTCITGYLVPGAYTRWCQIDPRQIEEFFVGDQLLA